MGYESRLYIVEKNHLVGNHNFGEKIAMFNLSCMNDNKFYNLFNKEIDFDFYAENRNDLLTVDDYDKKLKYTDIKTVINYLEIISKDNDYRRFKPLLSLLKGFDLSKWDNLIVVHYGY
jgi:hypothetical protein